MCESVLSFQSATTRFELVIRVLQTRALPLRYVAIFHGPDETLYFSSKHDFNKAPRFRQEIFLLYHLYSILFFFLYFIYFLYAKFAITLRIYFIFYICFSIIYFFSCTGFQRFLIYTKGTEGELQSGIPDMLKKI